MTPWRFIFVFGIVSLLMDWVYEGARSVTGPVLAGLGASGLVVGVVTGAGEAAALGLRLVSGPLADRTQRFWGWTIAGYVLTAASVPLLGVAGALWVGATLVILERVGKAVRSPAKDTLLSHATSVTGRGKGFAVHEALDQVGALAGPLTVAGMLALTGDRYGPALGVLAVPAVAAIALLLRLRVRVPDPGAYEVEPAGPPSVELVETTAPGLPRAFWAYCAFTAATMTGFVTFGLVSFHLVEHHLLSAPMVPVLYAIAMLADAAGALLTGWIYDRVGPGVLLALPVLAAGVPVLAFSRTTSLAVAGAVLWGAATGVQESTLRATVADLVPRERRATAYGVYAGVLGGAALVGGVVTGALYDISLVALGVVVAAIQVAAAGIYVLLRTRTARR